MKLLSKPKNKWGWLRITGVTAATVALLWTALATVLRGSPDIPWLAWINSQASPMSSGLELLVLALLALMAGILLEGQDARIADERVSHQETEQASAAEQNILRKEIHEIIQAALPGRKKHEPVFLAAHEREKINAAVTAVLPRLNGKGKGDILHFLHEHGLLVGEDPAVVLRGADLHETDLHKAQLSGAHLEGALFQRARLDGAHLENCHLAGADFQRALLRHTNLHGAQLQGCLLSRAHLENASLQAADLREANLDGTFLMHANLKHCTVNPALQAGNLPDQLDRAILVETILPDGRKFTNERGREYLRKKELSTLVDRL